MDAFRPLLIAGLVVTEVAIWQWRMVIAHRGSRVSAMLLGIIGAVLQITAITQVVADVSDPAGVIAYAVGVGFGVLLGLVAGEKFTPGMIGVTIVTKDPYLARSLWDRGWPVTAQSGRGESGPVTVLSVPVNRRDETRLHGDVRRIAPDAVCTTRDLRAPNSAYQSGPPYGLIFPDGSADRLFAAKTTMPFVFHLNWVFSHGGFRGRTAPHNQWQMKQSLARDLLNVTVLAAVAVAGLPVQRAIWRRAARQTARAVRIVS
jgi:uncharacterized protein YebE (UPF0316 family)